MMFPKPAPTPKRKPKPMKRTPMKRKTHLVSHGLKPIPEEIRAIVIERDGGVCLLCPHPVEHIHHCWKTRGAGGPNEPWNLCCLCAEHHDGVHVLPEMKRVLREKLILRGIVPPRTDAAQA